MQRFLRWMQAHGAVFPSVSIKVGRGVRQVHATGPLPAGTTAAYIPPELTITPRRARESLAGRLIAEHGSNLDDHDYLAAYLLQARRDGGFWQPYIDILPKDYSEIPLRYSGPELDELKGSYNLNAILHRISQHAYKYDQLPPVLQQNGFTREAFAWAKCVVATRNHERMRDGRPVTAMVPLSDMFNHAADANATWSVDAQGAYRIEAKQTVEAGAPLFQHYGRCNAVLLDHYGFCLEDNPKNVAEIRLEQLAPEHPFCGRTERLGRLRWTRRTFRVPRDTSSGEAKALFSYLRLACLHEAPQARPSWMDDHTAYVPPLTLSNEIAALHMLAEACESRLRQFPTSLEDDQARLREGGLSPNLRNITMVRRDEKLILTWFLELTQTALPVLREAPRDIGEHGTVGMPYAEFFADLARRL